MKIMKNLNLWLQRVPYFPVIMLACVMLIAPVNPEPHLVQKFNWLLLGQPFKLIDAFDVLWHLLPTLVLMLKVYCHKKQT